MAAPLIEKHKLAIELRLQGKSYSKIKKELRVSKSSLSLWLRNYPLSARRLKRLTSGNEKRIESYRETMRKKREDRLEKVYTDEKKLWLPLSKRELYLVGLFLYWGEGLKASSSMVSISNSDPRVQRFFIYWLTKILRISKSKLRVRIHFYIDMNIKKETDFWSRQLKLPTKQFNKPYIKKTTLKSLTYKGFGHGTCEITVGGVELKSKIMMGIKSISDYYRTRI